MKHLLHIVSTAAGLLLLLTGCVEEIAHVSMPSDHISFTADITGLRTKAAECTTGVSGLLRTEEREWSMEPATRGKEAVVLEGDAGIIAFPYKETWDAGENKAWSELLNRRYTFKGNMLEGNVEDGLVRWSSVPKDIRRIRIYAYSPFRDISIPDAGISAENLLIAYEVDSDVEKQEDLIAAETDVAMSDYADKSIPLQFGHVLTGIRFKMGFGCTVKSLSVENVHGEGLFRPGAGWMVTGEASSAYTVSFGSTGKRVDAGEYVCGASSENNDDNLTMMLLPQTLADGAQVKVIYDDGEGEKTLTAPLAGKVWEQGKMMTYWIYDKEQESDIIYFDLAAGNVRIGSDTYSGKIYVGGEIQDVSGSHDNDNIYYVYQSTGDAAGYSSADKQWEYRGAVTGWNAGKTAVSIPDYPQVKSPESSKGPYWSDFIKDNSDVVKVIETWDDGKNVRKDAADAPDEGHVGTAVVRDAGRTHTRNYILVEGGGTAGNVVKFNLTIDDIYSVIQTPVDNTQNFRNRDKGGIAYIPSGYTELKVNFTGVNRMGCLHIHNTPTDKIILEGTGSLTAADADFMTVKETGEYSSDFGDDKGYISNFWNSAIGNNTRDKITDVEPYNENVYNLYINSGIIFAGTTKTEDATAIGGGGNGSGQIYITGGIVTAVATSAGTAIGGGMGHTANGGPGEVYISGGDIYAYNHANKWDIASSAIGGGGSKKSIGSEGTVKISGGNIYAYSALGTAIGGGSSSTLRGGNASVEITGGYIVAKSGIGNGIGGGSGGSDPRSNGGSATVRISGTPVIRTGSVGGGKTYNTEGTIGSADILISGGDIQAQFVMAAGASVAPKFEMTGGLIRNSSADDPDDGYFNIVSDGGAVYMQDGSFKMSGGTIMDCSAESGGAVYIKKGDRSVKSPSFSMSGSALIKDCSATGNGGAVYLEDGTVTISGGTIEHCSSGRYGGAICVRKTTGIVPSFTMSGGRLGSNTAVSEAGGVYLEGGLVTVSGGEIYGNIVKEGNGGGIHINSGNFIMESGGTARIHGNSALMKGQQGGKGGGVYVTSRAGTGSSSEKVSVKILSGEVEGNSSALKGGGICVDMAEAGSNSVEVIVGDEDSDSSVNPKIDGNVTLHEGGGMYVDGSNANVTINAGKVKDNETVGYVDNPDIVNTTGMVTLNGGDVRTVTITYHGNGGTASGVEIMTQAIVTATNNILDIPSGLSRPGYQLKRWNTRPDGLGTENYTDGQIVNRNTDLTLYAIWE